MKFGQLAKEYCGKSLELQVLKSNAGYYIGTCSEDGPCSRESNEYFRKVGDAQAALTNGEWTQKPYP